MSEVSHPLHTGGFFLYNTCIRNSPVTQGSLPDRSTLSVKDAAALEAFYHAQRPHGAVYTWQQLRKQGAKPVPKEDPSLKQVCDAFNRAYGDPSTHLDYGKLTRKDLPVSDDSVPVPAAV